jgi:hypothetical protein
MVAKYPDLLKETYWKVFGFKGYLGEIGEELGNTLEVFILWQFVSEVDAFVHPVLKHGLVVFNFLLFSPLSFFLYLKILIDLLRSF